MQEDDPFNCLETQQGLLGDPEDGRNRTLHLKDTWTNLLSLTVQGPQNGKHLARLPEYPQADSWLWLQPHPQGSGLNMPWEKLCLHVTQLYFTGSSSPPAE